MINAKQILDYCQNGNDNLKKLEERYEIVCKELHQLDETKAEIECCLDYLTLSIHSKINMRSHNLLIRNIYAATFKRYVEYRGENFYRKQIMPFEYRGLSIVPYKSRRKYRNIWYSFKRLKW